MSSLWVIFTSINALHIPSEDVVTDTYADWASRIRAFFRQMILDTFAFEDILVLHQLDELNDLIRKGSRQMDVR